jgi:hypothetical protein
MGTVPAVAVVVASRGGRCLTRALAAVTWAAERAVLDPGGEVKAHAVPPGVRLVQGTLELEAAGSMPSIVLVSEDETLSEAFVDALAHALERDGPASFAVAEEVHGFGAAFALPGARVRVAPRIGGRLHLDRALQLALATPGRAARAPVPLVHVLGSLDDVVQALDADSSMLAVVLEASQARPRVAAVVAAALAASGRVLGAGAIGHAGLARWVLAVLTAYRALLAYAKLWERARARPGGTS